MSTIASSPSPPPSDAHPEASHEPPDSTTSGPETDKDHPLEKTSVRKTKKDKEHHHHHHHHHHHSSQSAASSSRPSREPSPTRPLRHDRSEAPDSAHGSDVPREGHDKVKKDKEHHHHEHSRRALTRTQDDITASQPTSARARDVSPHMPDTQVRDPKEGKEHHHTSSPMAPDRTTTNSPIPVSSPTSPDITRHTAPLATSLPQPGSQTSGPSLAASMPAGTSTTVSAPKPSAPNLLRSSMSGGSGSPPPLVKGPEHFQKIRLVGKGDVGRVYLVVDKSNNKPYAMKVLNKAEMLKRNKVKRALTEREILATTEHPFIVPLYYSFMSQDNLYFVMEFCAGGEFFRMLQKQPGKHLPEDHARFYCAEVVLALEYLHSKGFIYRDLKPENILIHSTGHIMLTDFDLSKACTGALPAVMMKKSGKGGKAELSVKPEMTTNSFVGTEEYIAPEVIEGTGHSSSVDWWTVGILTYEMLIGHTPYRGDTRDQTFDHILHAGLKFPDSPPVSSECKALLKKLLHPEPKKRLGSANGAPEIKAHKWFKGINWALIRNEKPPMVPRLNGPLDTSNFRVIEDPDLEKADMSGASAPGTAGAPDPFGDFTPVVRHMGGSHSSMQRDLSHSQIQVPVPKQPGGGSTLTHSTSSVAMSSSMPQSRQAPLSPPPSAGQASSSSSAIVGAGSPPPAAGATSPSRTSDDSSSHGKRLRQDKAKLEKKDKKSKKDPVPPSEPKKGDGAGMSSESD